MTQVGGFFFFLCVLAVYKPTRCTPSPPVSTCVWEPYKTIVPDVKTAYEVHHLPLIDDWRHYINLTCQLSPVRLFPYWLQRVKLQSHRTGANQEAISAVPAFVLFNSCTWIWPERCRAALTGRTQLSELCLGKMHFEPKKKNSFISVCLGHVFYLFIYFLFLIFFGGIQRSARPSNRENIALRKLTR